jgi:flagellar L-ring protein FlgH
MNGFPAVRWIYGVAGLFLFFAGCATPGASKITPPLEREKRPLMANATPASEGSLWVAQTSSNFYADLKARNVGDVVTVNIVEAASASKNAETKTSRNTALDASWSGVLSKIVSDWVGDEQKVALGNQFEGKGQTTRTSSLNAYITAQVVEVLPNGNLAIFGTRQVQVNNENQYIHLQGIIRPTDINSNNIVLSTYIAEAKIELSGQGVVSDKQMAGWFTRILDWVWPF